MAAGGEGLLVVGEVDDPGAFRFEYVLEAVAPNGQRTRHGAFQIPSTCLTCGGTVIVDDYETATASLIGTAMVTVDNDSGLMCVSCLPRYRQMWDPDAAAT